MVSAPGWLARVAFPSQLVFLLVSVSEAGVPLLSWQYTLGPVGLVVPVFSGRICPSTFVQSFRPKGMELPGVKTRLGSETSGCLSWRGTNESQRERGCLKFAAPPPPWLDPRSWETSPLSCGLGCKSLLRPKLASDTYWGRFLLGAVCTLGRSSPTPPWK